MILSQPAIQSKQRFALTGMEDDNALSSSTVQALQQRDNVMPSFNYGNQRETMIDEHKGLRKFINNAMGTVVGQEEDTGDNKYFSKYYAGLKNYIPLDQNISSYQDIGKNFEDINAVEIRNAILKNLKTKAKELGANISSIGMPEMINTDRGISALSLGDQLPMTKSRELDNQYTALLAKREELMNSTSPVMGGLKEKALARTNLDKQIEALDTLKHKVWMQERNFNNAIISFNRFNQNPKSFKYLKTLAESERRLAEINKIRGGG